MPKRDVLVENLEDSGYTIETLMAIEGSDLVVDRILAILAQNGNYVYCVVIKNFLKGRLYNHR